MISPEELVSRAGVCCKPHRQGVGGFCRECILAEIEQAIADEHPELDRGEVFEVVMQSRNYIYCPIGLPVGRRWSWLAFVIDPKIDPMRIMLEGERRGCHTG